jgi:copper(I)-binding protein
MHARLTLPALAVASLLALSACSTTAEAGSTTTPATDVTAAEQVTVEDPWVKSAETGMSAAFGQIENTGDADVTVVSVATPASTMLELHETVENETGEMVMREKDGGFTIPAGGALALEPGANHIMLMDLVEPVVAGDEVTFTLTFSDDSTLDFTAPAKDYAGADETYAEGHGDMDMSGH